MPDTNNFVFNMNNCYSLNSDSKGEVMQFGAFNGHMTIAIWRNGNGQKPIKINVSQEYFSMIIDAIDEAMKGVPGAAFPIKTLKWDVQTKRRDIANIFTVGKDTNNIYFIEYKEPEGTCYKFPFVGNKNFEGPVEGGDGDRSFRHFKSFARFIKMTWHFTSAFTRNNMAKGATPNTRNNNSKPAQSQSQNYNNNNASMASEDDIY